MKILVVVLSSERLVMILPTLSLKLKTNNNKFKN